jgi:hypothetical protein
MSWYSEQPFHVYLISAGSHQKIGSTSALKTRVAHLQNAHYEDLKLEFALPAADLRSARAIEGFAHALLIAHHVRGEWFATDTVTAKEAILAADAAVTKGARVSFNPRTVDGPKRAPVRQRVRVLSVAAE